MSLSLSFDELLAVQVAVRLNNGTFALDVQPLNDYGTVSAIPTSHYSEFSLHFQVVHDSLGPLLHVFTSRTRNAQSKYLRNCDDMVAFRNDNFIPYPEDFNTPLSLNQEQVSGGAPYSREVPSTFNTPDKLYPWTTSSHSFSDERPVNDNFPTAVNDGNLDPWTSQLLFHSLENKKDLISGPVLGDPMASFSARKLTPTTPQSPSTHSSEMSAHGSEQFFPPASSSRVNSSPPSRQSVRCSSDTSDNIATSSSHEMLAPSIGEETGGKPFACNELGCFSRFKSQHTLRSHMESHKPKRPPSFPCTLGCSERFTRQHDRLRHEVAKHGKVCEWSCQQCGRFFSTKKTFTHHKCPMTTGGMRWAD